MTSYRLLICLMTSVACVGLGSHSTASVIIDFGDFDTDVAGSVSPLYLDADTGNSGNITTIEVTDTDGTPGATIDASGSQRGIDNSNITEDESWTFSWNVDTRFLGIDWSGIGNGEFAGVQSDAWIGASITPGSANASFDSITGTFTLGNGESGDRFTEEDLFGTSTIPVISAGTGITIFNANFDTNAIAIGTDSTWELLTAIPEPGSISLLAAGLVLIATRRGRLG